MPIYKCVPQHVSSVRDKISYLTKGGRLVASAYLHCCQRDALGRDVARQMDDARHALGGDIPYGSEPHTNFYHIIMSPDPRDKVTPDEILDYAIEVLDHKVPDFQCFIAVHDDNTHHIPHAHAIVNNVSMVRRGKQGAMRASYALPLSRDHEFSRFRSRLAAERGWHTFTYDGFTVSAEEWFVDDARAEEIWELRQRMSAGTLDLEGQKRLEELAASGRSFSGDLKRAIRLNDYDYALERRDMSWKADLRDRITLACQVSSTENQYIDTLAALGVTWRMSESKEHPDEIVYYHPASGDHGIRGDRLGYEWSRSFISCIISGHPYDKYAWQLDFREPLIAALLSMEPEPDDPIQSLGHIPDSWVSAGGIVWSLRYLGDLDVRCADDLDLVWERDHGSIDDEDDFVWAARVVTEMGIMPEYRSEDMQAWVPAAERCPICASDPYDSLMSHKFDEPSWSPPSYSHQEPSYGYDGFCL